MTVPVQIAEKALAECSPDLKRFALRTLGAALYRAGRIDESIARLDESLKTPEGVGLSQSWAYLAMAYHKKGKDDEARRWLGMAQKYVQDEQNAFSTDLVEIRLLLRESEALLRNNPATSP